METETYLSSLNRAMHELMEEFDNIVVIGEDICDPYGGAFKVTKGLSTKYSKRVINTPISESAIVGIGTGLALQGYLPIIEIMFGDFITLVVDQVLNSAAKFGLMYGNGVQVPLVIRAPMGGGRGYGPTHSQSIEKIFFGMPGVKVISPSLAHDPGKLLTACVLNEVQVVIFIEHKNIYNNKLILGNKKRSIYRYEIVDTKNNYIAYVDNFLNCKPDIVILAYGGLSADILKVLLDLVEEEINVRAIFPSLINEMISINILRELIKSENGVLVAELGTEGFGWGGEVVSYLFEQGLVIDRNRVIRLASKKNIIPASKQMEKDVLVGHELIMSTLMKLML